MGIGAWLSWVESQPLGSVLLPELLSHAAGAKRRPLLLRWRPSGGSNWLNWSDLKFQRIFSVKACTLRIAKTPMANHACPCLGPLLAPRPPPATASNCLQLRQVQRIVAGIVACDSALRALSPLAVPRPSNYVKAQSSIEAWPKKPKQS